MNNGAGKANKTGQVLENQIERLLLDSGYTWLPQNRIEAAKILKQPFYTHQFPISNSLYEGKIPGRILSLYILKNIPTF